jgi:hypothetical protein
MPATQFNRNAMARSYAARHLKTDPGIKEIYYLPAGAPEREIRLLEVNDLIADRNKTPLEAIDFGVDIGSANSHTLLVLDVTPGQWEKIRVKGLSLPTGWSLEKAIRVTRKKRE